MSWQQLVTPRTDIIARPGMCLEAVQRSFRTGYSGPSATWAWENAKGRHDGEPPLGIAVPMFFAMNGEPAGHVVTRMRDGSIYSASDSDPEFDYHKNLQDLLDYYGGRLTLRGWSEYLGSTQIVKKGDSMAVSDAELEDLRKWKEVGMDAQQWKAALEASALWPLLKGDHKNIGAVANDLVTWKGKGLKLEQELSARYELVPYPVYRKM